MVSVYTHFYWEKILVTGSPYLIKTVLKISDTTQAEFFKLKFFQIDKKVLALKLDPCFRDFNMLTLHKSSEAGLFFSDLSAHAFCGSIISEINQLWGSSFFFKIFKIWHNFRNGAQKSENTFNIWDNCTFIGCVKHSFLPTENTCHWQSICDQTVSRFQILIRQNNSNWISFRLIMKYDKTTAVKI